MSEHHPHGLIFHATALVLCLAVILAACTQPDLPTELPSTMLPTHPNATSTETEAPPTAAPNKALPLPTATEPSRVIGVENASQVIRLNTLGKGLITGQPVFSPDGSRLVIPASTGFIIYNTHTNQEIRSIRTIGYASNAAFSPDGQLLATNSTNGPITLLDADGVRVRDLDSQTTNINYYIELAFSADGQMLASSCHPDDTIKVWRVGDGQLLYSFKASSFDLSPDSTMLAAWWWRSENDLDHYEVDLYSLADGSLLNQWEGQRAVFSPTNLLAVENKGIVGLMDIHKDLSMPSMEGSQSAFSADGQTMALYNHSQVMLYDVAKGALLRVLEGRHGMAASFLFAPDGQSIAGMVSTNKPACCQGGPDTLALWRVGDGKLITTLGYPEYSTWFTFSPDGQTLAVVDSKGVKLLNATDGTPQATLDGYTPSVGGIAFSPDGQIVASAAGEPVYHLNLWQVEEGKVVQRLENPGASGSLYPSIDVAFSPDGKIVAMGSDLYRAQDGSRMTELQNEMVETYSFVASSIVFSPDSTTLAVGYLGGQLHLWNLAANTLIRKLEGYTGQVNSLSYSPGGQRLAAVYTYPDDIVQIWQPSDGKPIYQISGALFKRVAYSPDGQTLATLAATKENDERGNPWGNVQLRRAEDGKELFSLGVQDATCLAFSPDGQILATGSPDGTVQLWQVADGKLLATFEGHSGTIAGLAFSPDGMLLGSGSDDGTVSLWGIK
jgi:WD40 repeat protein